MDALEELGSHLIGTSRAIVVSETDVDLRPSAGDNRLFLLKIAEGSLAAGGRGGGFGERKVSKVLCFVKRGGSWAKLLESTDEAKASQFEVPYYVSRLPIILADGAESMGYGVIEAELVTELMKKAGLLSPA